MPQNALLISELVGLQLSAAFGRRPGRMFGSVSSIGSYDGSEPERLEDDEGMRNADLLLGWTVFVFPGVAETIRRVLQ
jgi:hypothetical protein